jgi:hypothetical protein
MFRFIFWVGVIVVAGWFALKLPLGNRTVGEHVRRIWSTPEAVELRKDLKVEEERARRELIRRLDQVGKGDAGKLAPRSDAGPGAIPTAPAR